MSNSENPWNIEDAWNRFGSATIKHSQPIPGGFRHWWVNADGTSDNMTLTTCAYTLPYVGTTST